MKPIRHLFIRPTFATPQDLNGKNVVVTGVGHGSLGYATATLLAQWGANVIATTRSADPKLQAELQSQASPGYIRLLPLDLALSESVREFSQHVLEMFDQNLDILINCAGIHLDLLSKWKQPSLSEDGYELHWRVNYLGTAQLTENLLPSLLNAASASGDARIVNVSSMLHTRGTNAQLWSGANPYNSWVAYGLSKLALMHYTYQTHRRYCDKSVQSYCLHPGAINTPIGNKGLGTSPTLQSISSVLSPLQSLFMMSPHEGAQTQVMCATKPGLQGGRYYRNSEVAQASPELEDTAVAERLWIETKDWLDGLA